MSLPSKKRLVSIRAKVAAATLVAAPVSLKLQIQNPIIEKIYIFSSGATLFESGFRVLVNGIQAIPAIESISTPDMQAESNFIPLGGSTQEIKLGLQVPGSPYNVEVQFYNLSGTTPYYAAIQLLTAPKIELPKLAIENDKLSSKPENDS